MFSSSIGRSSAIIITLLAVLYIFTFSGMSSYDALCYYKGIESDQLEDLVHPHHLLYLPALKAWYFLWTSVGYEGTSVLPLRVFSFLGSLGALVAFALVLRLLFRRGSERSFLLLAFGLAFLTWHYASMVEPVSFFLFFSVLNLYFMLRVLSDSGVSMRLAVAMGAVNALAILFHQSLVLACPFSLVLLWSRSGRGMRWKAVLGYLAVLCPAVALPYLLVGTTLAGARSVGALYRWLVYFQTHFAERGLGHMDNVRPGLILTGIGRVFLGAASLKSYLVGGSARDAGFYMAALPFLSTALFLAVGLAALALKIRTVFQTRAREIVVVVVLAIVFGVVAAWWSPTSRTFWAPVLPCLLILAGLGFARIERPVWLVRAKYGILSLFVLLLLVGNLSGGILEKHRAGDEKEPLVVELRARVGPEDVVILEDGRLRRCVDYLMPDVHLFSVWLRGKGEQASHDAALLNAVEAGREALSQGRRVFVSSQAIPDPDDVLELLTPDEGAAIRVDEAFRYKHEHRSDGRVHTMFEVQFIGRESPPPQDLR